MKYRIFILIVVLLSGCVTSRKCFDKFPPPPPDTIVKHSVEWRDTTVFVELPGDTIVDSIIIEELIEIPVDIPYTFLYAETSLAEATASIENNKLRLELIQRDSLLSFLLDSAIQNNKDSIIVNVPYVKEVPVKTRYQTFVGFACWIFFGLLILFIGLIILRK